MVEIQTARGSDDLVIMVKARPRGRRNSIDGVHAGMLRITVTAVPEKGRANQRILEQLAESLQVPRSSVTLHSGSTSTIKKIRISGLSESELRSRLAPLIRT